MPARDSSATVRWSGDLQSGSGTLSAASGVIQDERVTWAARAEEAEGTNPEELIAAAHATCFSMAFSNELAQAGSAPDELEVSATVTFDKASDPPISGIRLRVTGVAAGLDEARFEELAKQAKSNCPVSRALTGTTIEVSAKLRAGAAAQS